MLIAEPVSVLWVGRAPHVLNRFGKHFRSASIAHARTVDRTAYSQKVKDCGSERLLRYPDGRVRCIRYPLITREAEAQVESIDVTVSYEEDWDPERWDDLDWSWDAHSLWQDTVSNKPAAATTAPVQPSQESLSLQKARHTFDSPADLLRALNAEGYMQAQKELMEQVRESYEIHTGSPWIQSRPVYVLVQQQHTSAVPVTYTLKTKVSWTAAEDELSKVLKRRRKDGFPVIKVDQLQDGIVLFEDVADAERYSSYMEAESSSQVLIAQCDAHDLFRNVREARGLVVLLRTGSDVPTPHQLAVSLRNKQSFENE